MSNKEFEEIAQEIIQEPTQENIQETTQENIQEPNFALISEYFQLKEQYENKIKMGLRNKKRNKPKCMFCNNDGGNLFKMTPNKYIISCKEKKCNQKQEYNRILKNNIEDQLKSLNYKIKNLISNINENVIFYKYKLDDSVNDENIQLDNQTLEDYITKYDELLERINYINNNNLEKTKELNDTKNKLIKELNSYHLQEFLNYNSIVKTNNEIQSIDNDILNYNYEVQYINDYFNRDIVFDTDVNSDKYNCSKPESKQVILKKHCIQTLENNLIE